jgi:hypothetical protein
VSVGRLLRLVTGGRKGKVYLRVSARKIERFNLGSILSKRGVFNDEQSALPPLLFKRNENTSSDIEAPPPL